MSDSNSLGNSLVYKRLKIVMKLNGNLLIKVYFPFITLEIKQYATYIGMDLERDKDLLWIAREALLAPLPEAWVQTTNSKGEVCYHNTQTNEIFWEHPSDKTYKALYLKEKKAKEMTKMNYSTNREYLNKPKDIHLENIKTVITEEYNKKIQMITKEYKRKVEELKSMSNSLADLREELNKEEVIEINVDDYKKELEQQMNLRKVFNLHVIIDIII